ncbi:MAG TPA: DUF4252 domain-containing protein [Bryobacteraceae bacterium]|nr:DUF4252 domain-containing protein [Bryobacteraceae bacterium]
MKQCGVLLLVGWLAMPLPAQQFKFNLDHLESKASDTVDVNLNGSTLQFAAKFLDDKDPDEAKVKKLIAGLQGIYVKSLQFKNDGEWSKTDLDNVKNQLHEPEWSRILGFKSAEEGETADVYVRTENKKITGVAIIAAEPKQLTVVNIAGAVDLESLADLSGHFGLPKLEPPSPGKGKKN